MLRRKIERRKGKKENKKKYERINLHAEWIECGEAVDKQASDMLRFSTSSYMWSAMELLHDLHRTATAATRYTLASGENEKWEK